MKIGDLKHRITFQTVGIVTDDNGFEVEEWVDYKNCFAKVSNLYGKEYFAAATTQSEKTVKFTIRFIEDIKENMRISFNEKYYHITSIDNIKYENKYMEIKALEAINDG